VSGDRPSPASFPVRALQLLRGVLGQIVTGGVVWVLVTLHLCCRRLRRKTVPAHDEPTRHRIRREFSRILLRRLPWRVLALTAGLIVLVGVAFVAGCVLMCFGVAAYFLRGE
jgi:hypothetical protein